MNFMFASYEPIWLLALIYQPIVLVYYIINDHARKPDLNAEGSQKSTISNVLHPISQIFSLSLSAFSILVFTKIVLMNVFGLEAFVFMLGDLILMLLVTIAYLSSFFATLNAKKLVYFIFFLVGVLITYILVIPTAPMEAIYDGEFSEFIIPFILPGLIGFGAFMIVVIAFLIIKRLGFATKLVQKMSRPFWDKKFLIQKIFGFYFHLFVWIVLVLETILNQSGYTIFSWGI